MIYELLERMNAVGRENAISRKALKGFTGLSDRRIRRQIEEERRNKMPIISNTQEGGYYLPETEFELRAYVSEQRSRIQSQILALAPLERELNGGM